ncbi:hypothetical protein NDU88_003622 [Pleurodeles waltl]|uniref:Uncharacterized protein n=1 Tax=Pleurodeles waltl TaxID=8319 RepID=A0AAV7QDE7_PLEWA|nr:hypothetical protein NDU88_003622 [Pleurodeles waltl]
MLEARWGPLGSSVGTTHVASASCFPPFSAIKSAGHGGEHQLPQVLPGDGPQHNAWGSRYSFAGGVPSSLHTEAAALTFVVTFPSQRMEAYLPPGCDLLPLLEHRLYRGLCLDCATHRTRCCGGQGPSASSPLTPSIHPATQSLINFNLRRGLLGPLVSHTTAARLYDRARDSRRPVA